MDNKESSNSAERPKRQRIQKSNEDNAPLLPMGEAAAPSIEEAAPVAEAPKPAKNIRPRKGKSESYEAPIEIEGIIEPEEVDTSFVT
ncbi:MAG: hypothetical protein RL127_1714, partial [Bacteroidota bacterium]